jgi:hypothetical protein
MNNDSGCNSGNCLGKPSYSTLQNTMDYSCDQACLCRFNYGRSDKDKMYYSWFVLDKPIDLPTAGAIPEPNQNNCGKYQ